MLPPQTNCDTAVLSFVYSTLASRDSHRVLTIDSKLIFKVTCSCWKTQTFTDLDAVGLIECYDRVVSARREGGRILYGPVRYTGSWRNGVDGQEN